MKILSFRFILPSLFLLFVFFGCISSTTKNRKLASLPRHIIISVHGIGGGPTTFGLIGKALTAHLKEINPNYQYEYYNFTYQQNKKLNNTFEYAEELLSDFIEEIFRDHPIQPEDKISIVAHSQGGLITMIWYVDTLISNAKQVEGQHRSDLARFGKYAKQVDSIVTIGTPFWGSKLATQLSDKEKFNLPMLLGSFNPVEMQDMAFGSNTVYKFRRSTIALSKNPILKNLFTARLVNIGGIFPKNKDKLYYKGKAKEQPYRFVLDTLRKIFFNIGFGGDRYESDIAVLAPSSHLKFLYADDLDKEEKNYEIKGEDFKEADFFSKSEWILTESLHSPLSESKNVGMAYIPESCLDINTCEHPTYRYILFSLANCDSLPIDRKCKPDTLSEYENSQNKMNAEDNEINKNLIPNLQGFEVEIVLRLPEKEYDLENPKWKKYPGVFYYTRTQDTENSGNDVWSFSQKKFFHRSVRTNSDKDGRILNTNPLIKVYLGEEIEPISKVVSWNDIVFRESSHTDLRLHFTGYIAPTEEGKKNPEAYHALIQNGIDLPLTVDLPGLHARNMVLKIKPAFSTFVEVQMAYDEHKR